jgi:glycine hydroxymethyltransferase
MFEFTRQGLELLRAQDATLYELLRAEYQSQMDSLILVAASSLADPSTLVCEGTAISNVTTEGYPGARFHAGCKNVDRIEVLAIERAKIAFRARYANVQPHSASSANEIILFKLLKPGQTILALGLASGGHLTHGSRASVSGKLFRVVNYGLDARGLIDYESVQLLAEECRPRLIICGASSYPRALDFPRFRRIADSVGAYLLADISHIAGLVAGDEHPSPIEHAHFTTTSTYKQLCGPRGGLILMGKDAETAAPEGRMTLSEMIQNAVFPFFQGTPHLGAIAAKARALALVSTPEWKKFARRIVANAQVLAGFLKKNGFSLITGGTDNHMILMDVLCRGMTGLSAERTLEDCNILVNRNCIPNDKERPSVTSGIRLGTNTVAARNMGVEQMERIASVIDYVLRSVRVSGNEPCTLPEDVRKNARAEVRDLCLAFPIPNYPRVPHGARAAAES